MELEFYETEDGKKPIEEFLSSLDKKMRAKAIWLMEYLEEEGQLIKESYPKHLEEGIFELRIKSGTDISKILYFFFIGDKAI